MVEFGVIGAKNSGKTTVIEGLIKYLINEGYRVATIKHTSHSHRFDKPGKDTYRHREAGASLTVAISKGETAIFAEPGLIDIGKIRALTNQPIDIILVEGDREAERPKILVTRELKEFAGGPVKNIVATIGPEKVDGVTAHFETDNYAGLGTFIIKALKRKKTEIGEQG